MSTDSLYASGVRVRFLMGFVTTTPTFNPDGDGQPRRQGVTVDGSSLVVDVSDIVLGLRVRFAWGAYQNNAGSVTLYFQSGSQIDMSIIAAVGVGGSIQFQFPDMNRWFTCTFYKPTLSLRQDGVVATYEFVDAAQAGVFLGVDPATRKKTLLGDGSIGYSPEITALMRASRTVITEVTNEKIQLSDEITARYDVLPGQDIPFVTYTRTPRTANKTVKTFRKASEIVRDIFALLKIPTSGMFGGVERSTIEDTEQKIAVESQWQPTQGTVLEWIRDALCVGGLAMTKRGQPCTLSFIYDDNGKLCGLFAGADFRLDGQHYGHVGEADSSVYTISYGAYNPDADVISIEFDGDTVSQAMIVASSAVTIHPDTTATGKVQGSVGGDGVFPDHGPTFATPGMSSLSTVSPIRNLDQLATSIKSRMAEAGLGLTGTISMRGSDKIRAGQLFKIDYRMIDGTRLDLVSEPLYRALTVEHLSVASGYTVSVGFIAYTLPTALANVEPTAKPPPLSREQSIMRNTLSPEEAWRALTQPTRADLPRWLLGNGAATASGTPTNTLSTTNRPAVVSIAQPVSSEPASELPVRQGTVTLSNTNGVEGFKADQ